MPFQERRTGLFVYVPHQEPPFGKCTVIVSCTDDGEKQLCNTPLYSRGEYERHTARCAREHMQEIRKASLRERMPGFYGPTSGIPDVQEWLQRQDLAGDSNRAKVIRGERKL